MKETAAIDAAILCGGLGTRLRNAVPDHPKGLATIQGRPFLDLLVDDLRQQEIQRFIFCVGHMKEQIIGHFSGRRDGEFLFSIEDTPLGTGGAIRNALPLIRSDPFLVLNGDSFCRVDYAGLLNFHHDKTAGLTLVAAPPRERTDGGTLQLDRDGRVAAFEEKAATALGGARFINAGIYAVPMETARAWRFDNPFSLEREVIPQLVAEGRCFGFAVASEVIDIGTPDRYRKAQGGLWRH